MDTIFDAIESLAAAGSLVVAVISLRMARHRQDGD